MVGLEEPDGASHAVLLGVETWTSTGLPRASCPRACEAVAGPLPAPRLRRLASAPPLGRDERCYSPGDTLCQEQSENIVIGGPPHEPTPAPSSPASSRRSRLCGARRLSASGRPGQARPCREKASVPASAGAGPTRRAAPEASKFIDADSAGLRMSAASEVSCSVNVVAPGSATRPRNDRGGSHSRPSGMTA
jgi:hypothetical protein